MEASTVDLRYKMKDVLKALEQRDQVTVLYRGKPKGVLLPMPDAAGQRVVDHPFFGMYGDADNSVDDAMDALCGGHYR